MATSLAANCLLSRRSFPSYIQNLKIDRWITVWELIGELKAEGVYLLQSDYRYVDTDDIYKKMSRKS
jgi:hypothetical protein